MNAEASSSGDVSAGDGAEKLHGELGARIAGRGMGEPLRVIIRFRDPQVGRGLLAATLEATQVRHFELVPASALIAPPSLVQELARDPNVEVIWEDLPVHTMLDFSVPHIQVPAVWGEGRRGRGVTIAVVDTGIDEAHPDFTGRIVATQAFGSPTPHDGNGHGTHVASIIAGDGRASNGRYVGVAPEASLLAAKVLRDDGSGFMSDVMAGVEWAVQRGARVINLSLGSDGSCDGTDALSVTCDAAVGRGVVVCVAAGNAGPAPRTVGSPGCARNVITVGASTDNDAIASFSSRGPTKDGRVKPDIVFPGHNIIAARAQGTSMGSPVDQFYTSASGTSMATPHCSGAVALMLEAEPTLAPLAVKQRLMSAAVNLGLDANTQGAGRADVYAAVHGTTPTPPPTPPPTPEPPPGCLGSVLRLLRLA